MTQYNDITVKLKNSQLDKLKLVTKSFTILNTSDFKINIKPDW